MAATLAPQAEPTMLATAIAGLNTATMWICNHAQDGDGHSEAVAGIIAGSGLLAALQGLGPTVVDDLINKAIQQAQWDNQRTARGEG